MEDGVEDHLVFVLVGEALENEVEASVEFLGEDLVGVLFVLYSDEELEGHGEEHDAGEEVGPGGLGETDVDERVDEVLDVLVGGAEAAEQHGHAQSPELGLLEFLPVLEELVGDVRAVRPGG